MPTMLTLGVKPRRDPRALFADLLIARCADPVEAAAMVTTEILGSASVPLSTVGPGDPLIGRLVHLDVEPPAAPRAAEYYGVVATDDQLADALALELPSPLVVYCPDGDVVDVTARIDRAGRHAGLDVRALAPDDDRIADFLAVIAHAERGFLVSATDADSVLSVVAGIVAALRGDDVRRALLAPDVGALLAMHPDAAAATREVLLGVEVPDAERVAAELARRISSARGA